MPCQALAFAEFHVSLEWQDSGEQNALKTSVCLQLSFKKTNKPTNQKKPKTNPK